MLFLCTGSLQQNLPGMKARQIEWFLHGINTSTAKEVNYVFVGVGLFVCLSVYLFVVSTITQKVINSFMKFMGVSGVVIGRMDEILVAVLVFVDD